MAAVGKREQKTVHRRTVFAVLPYISPPRQGDYKNYVPATQRRRKSVAESGAQGPETTEECRRRRGRNSPGTRASSRVRQPSASLRRRARPTLPWFSIFYSIFRLIYIIKPPTTH